LKKLVNAMREAKRAEFIMSIVMLAAVSLIACNVNRVVDKETVSQTKIEKRGQLVVIDPGHGGKDPGKVGVNEAKEKDVNLAIGKELAEVLLEEGFDVAMTRTEDTSPAENSNYSKVEDLNLRCRISNGAYEKNKQSIMVSIHQNSFTKESVHGAQSFYYQRSEASKKLGETVQAALNKNINSQDKKAKPNDSYYILINSKCPGIIVECGFLSNSEEAEKLTDASYQKKMAKILSQGIKAYFDNIG
jgi:N-acetylmuramoyl-L-alanine amidase